MDAEPDLAALRALTMIAEHGSISAASHHLGLSQQALSLRVRALESHLHVRLLARSPRGSHLTPSGELVVGWARAVLSAAEDFTQALTSLHNSRNNTLSIMASLTIAEHLLPEWIARWRGQLGDDGTVAKLTAANSTTVIAAVNEGTVDLGFIETPTIPADLGSVTVGHDTIEVVTSTSHPWAQTKTISSEKLAHTPLVLRESGSGTRRALEMALERAGSPLTAEPAAVIPTTLGVRSSIMANTAPGALSSLAIAEDVQSGRLARIHVRGLNTQRPLTAIWAGERPTPTGATFLASITQASQK
ncbi:LysR family transcriptional regulator [Ancrocorticia populi]|uniref:LysR family transcriptional regulator n=1 Tax=Ancrocorticia populi TaxID=2175228 RepID=UPI003F9A1574